LEGRKSLLAILVELPGAGRTLRIRLGQLRPVPGSGWLRLCNLLPGAISLRLESLFLRGRRPRPRALCLLSRIGRGGLGTLPSLLCRSGRGASTCSSRRSGP
jgi:hypothetical protein